MYTHDRFGMYTHDRFGYFVTGVSNTAFSLVLIHVVGVKRFAKGLAFLRIFNLPVILMTAPFAGKGI